MSELHHTGFFRKYSYFLFYFVFLNGQKSTTTKPDGADNLQQQLKLLPWKKSKVPPGCPGGMSVIHCKTLVQAVIDYMIENVPDTPEEFNFQAELKAASHWRWFNGKQPAKPISGPHDDFRIKWAANEAFMKWRKDLAEAKQERSSERQQSSTEQKSNDHDASSSSPDESVEEYISGEIFVLHVIFNELKSDFNQLKSKSMLCC